MIKISRLLSIDEKCRQPGTLDECLGDSYLYAKNRWHRAIRNAFLEQGGSYSRNEDEALWQDYQICPLLCLQRILDAMRVPYVANASACRRLAERNADFALSGASLLDMVRRNFPLHESAHCIAHRACMESSGLDEQAAGEFFVYRSLASEAFANTVEQLAFLCSTSDTEVLLYSINCYCLYKRKSQEMVVQAMREHGAEAVFRVAFLCYFFENAHPQDDARAPADWVLDHALRQSARSEDREAILRELIRDVFRLNLRFRNNTSPIYFRLHGWEEAYQRYLDTIGAGEATNEPRVFPLMERLWEVLGAHLQSQPPAPSARMSNPQAAVYATNR
jgi:hypothetical protein